MFGRRLSADAKIWRKRDNTEWVENGIPDSYNPQGLCPRCNHMSNFEVLGFINISDDPRYRTLERDGTTSANPEERMTGLKCRGCGRGMAIVEEMCFRNYQPGSGEVLWRANFAWPLPTAQVSDDVPEAIAGIYREL